MLFNNQIIAYLQIRYVALFVCILLSFSSLCQDDCSNASIITIGNNGFGVGTFQSASIDLATATVETNEVFAPIIQSSQETKKSVWYKFSLPTTRTIKITLAQSGNSIPK